MINKICSQIRLGINKVKDSFNCKSIKNYEHYFFSSIQYIYMSTIETGRLKNDETKATKKELMFNGSSEN